MSLKAISIRGAREHNLKGIDIDIPRDRLVVITGLSGSGKSSLAFDTIYAEGQRKYMESLSAYARQFLDQLQKPNIESIEGLPPTIAIEQRSASHNPRSTVATTTEIYDYLRLLFARVGQPRCWHREEVRAKGQAPGAKGKKGKGGREQETGDDNPQSAIRDPQSPGPWPLALGPHVCGRPIESQNATQIVDQVYALAEGTKLMVLAPVIRGKKGHHQEVFDSLIKEGFVRARADGVVLDMRELKGGSPFTTKTQRYQAHRIEAVVDRIVVKHDDATRQRLADSIELSLKVAEGLVIVSVQAAEGQGPGAKGLGADVNPQSAIRDRQWTDTLYSEKYACPLHPECSLSELEPRLFSFNSPYGACPACGGLGTILEFDADLIVPDTSLTLGDGAIEAWKKHGMRMNIFYKRILRRFCRDFDVGMTTPFEKLSKAIQRILMHGTTAADEAKYDTYFEGVVPGLQRRFENTESEYVKEKLHEYLSEAPCETCGGGRLRIEARHVFVEAEREGQGPGARGQGADVNPRSAIRNPQSLGPHPSTLGPSLFNIRDVTAMTIEHATGFFSRLRLSAEQQQIAAPILKEIQARLGFMLSVGLGYLSLDRATGSLSGGEAQRIRLATQVGSGLVGCCYVLDEPTIGLHQRDNDRLIRTLRHLTDIGNTVIVVEHDEDTIRAADWLIDIGPGPGRHGGQVVAQGTVADVLEENKSLTAKYLSGEMQVPVPLQRRTLDHKKAITIKGARENNLKNVDAAFPLGGILCVTGVSGSGKSTLVNQILLRAAKKHVTGSREKPGAHDRIVGLNNVDRIIEVDQSPIGRTPRSNPATYTGVFDLIRVLFSQTKESKIRGYKPGRFSFNVKGGRCEACQGQGTKKIEMHFLPDVFVECEVCRGKRYNRGTLEVKYRGKSIADVLNLTIEESLAFFENFSNVTQLLAALNDVGLSYVQLGQASTTLSGGEAQRVKLATELGKRPTGHTLYVLDEPTTGLHFADVDKLMSVLHRLADAGNTLIVIEHNMDVIQCADWLIDLGPEGGERGGTIVAAGSPEDVMEMRSYTGEYLAKHLKREIEENVGATA
ncbi:MAG: excinuclease ABC subunit UvrA [Phycisphaeraceae bacterium]